MRIRNEQTICAISTPPGVGGLALVRLSGPDALKIILQLAPSLLKKNILSHHVYLAKIKDSQQNVIDEVVISYFENGKSFTGEQVIEISCHGSEYITAKVIELLIDSGSVMAEKGEFTFRAFMNNRLDLVQAESVLSLIESQNQAAARIAMRQLQGQVSKEFQKIEDDLTWCLAHIEASIDFSTEGLEVVDPDILNFKLAEINEKLKGLAESYKSGRIIKDGIKTVLLGQPNAGKSSLLNLFVEDDKAIVTPLAGTTRDIIQVTTVHQGLRFTISDTAGLRDTSDLIEKIGVERSQKEAHKADVVLYVLDSADEDWGQAAAQIKTISSAKIVLLNKADLSSENKKIQDRKKLQSLVPTLADLDIIFTSHLDRQSRDRVLTAVKNKMGSTNSIDEAMVTSARQYEMAKYAWEMLEVAVRDLERKTGAEFVAMYLKESLISVQKILGHVYDDQILDRVFKEFCLGK